MEDDPSLESFGGPTLICVVHCVDQCDLLEILLTVSFLVNYDIACAFPVLCRLDLDYHFVRSATTVNDFFQVPFKR